MQEAVALRETGDHGMMDKKSALSYFVAFIALAPWSSRAATASTEVDPEPAVVWETEGDIVCGWNPPERPDGFSFDDDSRWTTTGTDGGGLDRGEPTTVTWGFVADNDVTIGQFGVGEPITVSNLISFLDGIYGSGPGGSDLTQRPWFSLFEMVFSVWGDLIGVDYVYEPNDDGADWVLSAGVVGVRADVRIGGHSIDGQSGSNTLAYNFFPNFGDMVIDTDNSSFYGDTSNNSRGLRNVLAHEHGHGLGIGHVCPIMLGRLMEPFIDTSFDGPQEDDILAANRGYGDRDEFPGENDSSGTATSLGSIAIGGSATQLTISVDGSSDQDYYSFDAPADAGATVTLTPTGSTYLSGPQNPNGSCSAGTSFNALTQSDLGVELRSQSNSILASADDSGVGGAESIENELLTDGAGTYFVRVFGSSDVAQMYELTVALGAVEADLSASLVDSADPSTVGSSLTLTTSVTNAGPYPAEDVVVTLTLPAEVTLIETRGCAEDPSGIPTCSIGTIASGDSEEVEVIVSVDSGVGSSISTSISVASATNDPQSANNSRSETTTISGASCFTGLYLDNQTVTGTEVFEASGNISAADGFVIAGPNGDATFRAGSRVALLSGFSTEPGGTFTAIIDPTIDCP